MVKDRLDELKKRRDKNAKEDKNCTIEMENIQSDDGESANSKLRKTFERAEVIRQWVEKIEKNNDEIRQTLRKIDDTKYNHKDVENKLKSFFDNNKTIAQEILNKLKEVDEKTVELNDSAEKRIKNIQFTTLKTRYQKAFLENNQLLESYRNTQKQIIRAQLRAKGNIDVSDDELTSLLEEGKDIQVFTENILAETAEAKLLLANVEERHQKLLQIERQLTEVRDLFVQMSILIDSQQELVDRIEYQAMAASEHVEKGANEVKKADHNKKKYRKRKIYFIIAIVVLLIIILILIFK